MDVLYTREAFIQRYVLDHLRDYTARTQAEDTGAYGTRRVPVDMYTALRWCIRDGSLAFDAIAAHVKEKEGRP